MLVPLKQCRAGKSGPSATISVGYVNADGRLVAINPESGYFGVAQAPTLRLINAFDMVQHDTIFTNVALTADNQPWWKA
jgi:phosphoenolpyruvate carboxykinase (GTP)